MEAQINMKTQSAQEIFDGYMAQIEKLSADFEATVSDPDAPDYYVRSVDKTLNKLETLAHLYMNIITEFKGSRKK